MKIATILCPVDYSLGSFTALTKALDLAASFRARVEVLHVWELPHSLRPDLMVWLEGSERSEVSRVVTSQAAQEMARFLEKLPLAQRQILTTKILEGNIIDQIIKTAKDGGFDMIVMGTHGRTGLEHVLLGSIAERTIRRATCPVLTVRMHAGSG